MAKKRKTKIVCTIGPASSAPETVREMIKAGMAWHYSFYDNTPSYKLAQQQAKKG